MLWYWQQDIHIALWNRIKGTKKSSHLWPNDFQQICQDPPMGIGQSFQQMLLERQYPYTK